MQERELIEQAIKESVIGFYDILMITKSMVTIEIDGDWKDDIRVKNAMSKLGWVCVSSKDLKETDDDNPIHMRYNFIKP